MKKIQILGKDYKVEYVDANALGGAYGDCCTKQAYIRINKGNYKTTSGRHFTS